MNPSLKEDIWRQFGASIDMLENAIKLCPSDLWDSEKNFWYITYHCLFWLDYYLTPKPSDFSPPAPYTLSEFDPSGTKPDRTYSKKEMLSYLSYSRKKCLGLISSLTEDIASSRWINDYKNYSVFEILLYNMRHVQHHTAQLNLILRQEIDNAPQWVSVTNIDMKK
ncbi:DinB family protein [Allomuricauda taeanensis]|uniref:DinB family protein n=1 Tax=Flagellimonas taeanensis TaxID=1005926 RepID=UPI002E7BA92A|nr:DinB family protein [Allomuricauda taeanensis]MEE1962438.1 DinB family protein [Allomuricauda taeanensis]